MLQVLKESALLSLAMAAGLFAFRHLNLFYRLLLFQVILAFLTFLGAHAITTWQVHHHLPRNNHVLYNIYILGEGAFLMGAGLVYFKLRREKIIVAAGFILFLIVFIADGIKSGFTQFANQAMMVEGVIIVFLFLVILFRTINNPLFSWKTSAEGWLCLGITVYFGCNIPFIGMIHYLYAHHPQLTQQLFHFITDVLGNIRYLFSGIAFWIVYRQHLMIKERA